ATSARGGAARSARSPRFAGRFTPPPCRCPSFSPGRRRQEVWRAWPPISRRPRAWRREPTMTLEGMLAGRRIVFCVGSGGVGKTTTAAALAVETARRGRKTAVLTVDPAPRLKDTLGLDALEARPARATPSAGL